MIHAEAKVNPERLIGEIDRRIYGQYIENLTPADRPIYDGVCSEDGELIGDVITDLREMVVPALRWGGNYNDVYNWKDGIGPRSQRPVRPNYFWGGYESNRFGTHEFLELCERLEAVPFISLNLGTGSLLDALAWVEYCNHTGNTALSQLRAQNGHPIPWQVPLWGIGNEAWGKWEACYSTPEEYVERFNMYAQYLRRLDPNIQLVAVGHTRSDWNRPVLKGMDVPAEFLSVHSYGHSYLGQPDNFEQLMALPEVFDRRFTEVSHDIQHYSSRPIAIALDEWNVRHFVGGKLNRQSHRQVQDGMFVASVFHAMQRHCQVVKMANYVCMVNGNAPLVTTGVGNLKTPVFHIFRLFQSKCQSQSVETKVQSPSYRVTPPADQRTNLSGDELAVHYLDAAGTVNPEKTCLVISGVNRHPTDEIQLEISISDWGTIREINHVVLTGVSPDATQAEITERKEALPADPQGSIPVRLPAHSVNLITIKK